MPGDRELSGRHRRDGPVSAPLPTVGEARGGRSWPLLRLVARACTCHGGKNADTCNDDRTHDDPLLRYVQQHGAVNRSAQDYQDAKNIKCKGHNKETRCEYVARGNPHLPALPCDGAHSSMPYRQHSSFGNADGFDALDRRFDKADANVPVTA